MSTTCGTVVRVIYAFVDGELDAIETSAVSVHLAECPRCKAEVVVARTVKTVVRRAYPHHAVPAEMDAAIRNRFDHRQ